MARQTVELTPNHPLIREYYQSISEMRSQAIEHELAVRQAFLNLLADSARLHHWTFIPELDMRTPGGNWVRPDGTLRDALTLPRGYWEAKDTHDDLDREIEQKIHRGYPLSNIIFEDTRRGVLYQNRSRVFEADLADPRQVSDLLHRFYSHTEPDIRRFEEAVGSFEERVPELARGLAVKITDAHKRNKNFKTAFASFFSLCQVALNPNIRREAVDEMLIQHLLTERLFRTVFDNPEFTRRNAIAVEVECVIDALVSNSFSRNEYLRSLDPFYAAIEAAARTITAFGEKQQFLNTVYERFFRGYSVKVADTHGIVYTPPAIVEYMCDAVATALKEHFGVSLSSQNVHILDPCTGTGNFVVHLMQRMQKKDLPHVYRQQLFANEVMLMPYYIAAMNIEHAYMQLTAQYEPFEGICFVDTLDLAEGRQLPMFVERNTERVDRQKRAPINVIIGNPPYNVGQLDENDNNKNRKYSEIDRRLHDTYVADGSATLRMQLYDPYVRFFRWATDRLQGRNGIVCFVSNNSFVHQSVFDGMRKHLYQDFTFIDHIDLHGNVRRNPKLSGTTHNVFGIQVGVGITLAVRCNGEKRLRYHRVPEFWRKEEKLAWLKQGQVSWQLVVPDSKHRWSVEQNSQGFEALYGLTDIFDLHGRGVQTGRDEWVFGFSREALEVKIRRLISNYNSEVERFLEQDPPPADVNTFINTSPDFVKWTDRLKTSLAGHTKLKFSKTSIRSSMYRPFLRRHLYFDPLLVHRRYRQHEMFPVPAVEEQNLMICCTNHTQVPFMFGDN